MTDRLARIAELEQEYLPDELLERIRERAGEVDRQNAFFDDDLAELRDRGYLRLFVPESFGGPGLTLQQVARLQRRLATAAGATALAVNMHLMCTGVARVLAERGDDSLDDVFRDAADGELFAFGISEPGNDWVLQGSNTVAERAPDGDYLLSGVKIFTSLSPAWTRLITHGLDTADPDDPRLVFGFLDRETDGITVSEDWDVLGMRGSQSRATTLDGARMRADRVVRRIPPGRHPDLLTFGITANFQLLIGSVYAGVAERSLRVAAEALRARRSAKAGTTLAEVSEWRVRIADGLSSFEPVSAQLDAITRDVDELVDHGAAWPLRLVSARIAAARAALDAAEIALRCSGGAGFDNRSEASRLYRDAAAGLFHPPSEDAARPMFAAALLDED
ncbi:acyl-CoA dehydrogenase [Pseudoclavibacter chungangensis]|uniref:Acyl-CoA dehydrogenase n=1 Tax=Pseudoclavibacter chungangensis TaxID=587635 RepID=A0A7J5BM34_9MICO|nr:acyl-CoA dehydrogenase family protein [Pseudoclavibacter chungangensis]KAB1651917.1 acyl-CoA dehydrogenase [Pseudoclavibacter chungangensis]NYJ66886.1 alkylation response protein AidB-like acyl-CoA dehydrogenase [Pseudoclavibacter chungangensis]